MKISIYQPNRKNKKGEMKIIFSFIQAKMRAISVAPLTSLLPLKKIEGAGIGVIFDRKEPNGRVKLKRLESMYWALDEYRISHPNARPEDMKKFFEREFKKISPSGELIKVMEEYISSGKIGKSTAAIMQRTLQKVKDFDASAGFDIDEDWLDRFSTYLINNGIKTNGVGLHLRNIRTIFNYARKKRLTKEYPFLDYQIKVERKTIRNMTVEQVREFKDYPCEAWQVEYRDMFMLMVYLAGVNVGDLLLCKGLVNGRLEYSRQKTNHPMSIYVCTQAQEIIDKYKGENWLLCPMDRYKDYHGYMHKMNDGLKKIGKLEIVKDKVGKMRKHQITPFFEGLSTYVARYTFASIAAECGIERDIIAACLGHSWSDVTSHYIAYAQKKMDEAIIKVADYISKK